METDIRDVLSEANEDMLFLDEEMFDEALVGIVEWSGGVTRALYDKDKCIEVLMAEGMTEEDALDHFYYNVIGSYVGENTPAFMTFAKYMF